jgi:methionyl-tRNA synthetase
MPDPILVAVAWPYANAEIHVGNLTGAYLPADIFARFQRLKGQQVLMVSGTDSHGTPITVRADNEGVSAVDVYQRFHETFLQLFLKLGLTYDIFTSTHTSNHFSVAQKLFLSLKENGYLYTDSQLQWYSPVQKRFLPDRYVEGTCYICGFNNARSDQCDKCGNLLDATKLIDPRSKIDGSTPELRTTEHFYLDLGKLQPRIIEFLKTRESYWRPNVMRQSLGQIVAEDLHGRAITRDLDWGIPVPAEGWDDKRLYVWFEAVIGYLSSSIEWSGLIGQPDAWKKWWQDDSSRTYYFIGKDNIPFHAIIWPAELIGAGTTLDGLLGTANPHQMILPYDVPANEFLNLEGQRISGSRNWAVWGLDFLERYDPDALRYYLTMVMPETKDTEWDWNEFYHRNNDELVATWGNLVNRVLAFTYKHWEGIIPDPGELRAEDRALLDLVEGGFNSVNEEFETVHLRAALNDAMGLATEVNRYLDVNAPWFEIKTSKEMAAKSVYTALRAIDSLKILLAPFLPYSCDCLHGYLGYDGSLFGKQSVETIEDELGTHTVLRYHPETATGKWVASQLPAGQHMREPRALFKKLDESIIAEERLKLGK